MNHEKPFIPFAKPDITEAEVAAVSDAVRGGWLTTGEHAKSFEDEFATFIGGGVTAIAVSSATAGLHLALESAGIGPGDEVLVPTWTFTATAEVVRYLGAVPVLVDVDPNTHFIDFELARDAVTERTRAIMPVHMSGLQICPSEIHSFAERFNLKVIEDAAHAFPASAAGTNIGTSSSHATVFSFYATKTITTGEGGMVVTRDPEAANRMRTMRLHGISRDVFDRYSSRRPSWHYEVVAPGYKYNLPDPAAAIGRIQLQRASEMREKREDIYGRYMDMFRTLPVTLPPRVQDLSDVHSHHLFMLKLSGESERNDFVEWLAERGIGTSVHFIPLHLHPYWRDFGHYKPEDFPNASREYGRVVSLPIFSSMSTQDVDRVVSAVESFFS